MFVSRRREFILTLIFLILAQITHAGVNKCIVNGKTIYTETSCPENTSQDLMLKDISGFGSQNGEAFSFKIKDKHNWYKLDSKTKYQLTKYLEPYNDWNPTISIIPLVGGPFKTPDDAFVPVLSILKSNYQNIVTSREITDAEVAEYKAYYKQYKYDFIHDGVAYPITGDFWLIPKGKNVVAVVIETKRDDKSGSKDEAQKIVNSLEFTK